MGRLFIDARRKYPEIGVLLRRSWDCAPACVDRRPPLPIRIRGGRGLYENAAPIFIRYACGDAGIIWFPGASQGRGGRVSPSIHRKRGDPLTRFQARNLPGAASHWQSPDTCPPPGKGAIQRERFSDDTQETGAGDVPSLLPGEPHPPRLIPPRYTAREEISLPRSR